jgi:hypothetical protein
MESSLFDDYFRAIRLRHFPLLVERMECFNPMFNSVISSHIYGGQTMKKGFIIVLVVLALGAIVAGMVSAQSTLDLPRQETPTATSTTDPNITPTAEPATSTPDPNVTATVEPTVEAPTATPTEETPGVELVDNGGFELLDSNNLPDLTPWTVANGSGDKIKCNKEDKVFAYSGNCAFRFKGSVGENSKLKQNLDTTGATPMMGDALNVAVWVNGGGTPDGSVTLKVKYSDATEKTKEKVDFAAGEAYAPVTFSGTLGSAAVEKITLQFANKGVSGKVFIDDASVKWVAGGNATATPTVEVTVEATGTATVEATIEATSTATVEATIEPTATPTETPQPV